MIWMAIIAGLSLFSGIDYRVAGFTARPFDLLVAFMAIGLLGKVLATGRLKVVPGFVWLLPFIAFSVLSATTISTMNGIREGLQMLIVLTFAMCLSNADEPWPHGASWKFLLCTIWALVFFNAGWHINEGFVTGWKRLDELKHTISITIMLTFIWIALRHFRPSLFQLLAFGLLGGMVIMSGERKSMLVYAFALITMMSAIGVKRSLQVLIAPVAFVAIAVTFFLDEYMLRILGSLTLTTEYNIAGTPESFSNQQRAFAFKTGMELFENSPIIGVGTNGFEMYIKRFLSYYPTYFLKGIHGEFFRVLVENGLFGFVLYLSVWISSAVRTINVTRSMRSSGRLTAGRAKDFLRIYFMFIVASGAICGLEASGTDLYVYLVLVSLWPDMYRMALQQQSARVPRPADTLELSGV